MSISRLAAVTAVLFSASICLAQIITIPGPTKKSTTPTPAKSGNTGQTNQTNQTNQSTTPKPVDELFSGTYKFDSFDKGTLTVKSFPAGTPTKFANVSEEVARPLASAAVGDMLNLQGKKTGSGIVLSTIAVYTPRPGEDDPMAYIFVSKGQTTIGNETFTAINVKKYFDTITFAVPNTGGRRTPDADMLKAVDTLVADDMVEIDGPSTGNPRIARMIRPYGNVTVGKFSRAIRQTDPAAATGPTTPAATGKIIGLTVLNGDQPVSFNIDPASRYTAILAEKIMRYKEGQIVIIRSTKGASAVWLIDIRMSPVQELPKPRTTMPADQPPTGQPPAASPPIYIPPV